MIDTVFTGTATALITPFDETGKEVDYCSFEKLVNFQVQNCVDALVVAGTTGESPVLTTTEKSELIRIAKLNSKGLPVIAGTGSNNTMEAVRKSNEAEKQGVNGLLIVTPYYNKCTQEGIIKHYSYISERVSTPIIVYNVPSRTGVNIHPETYKYLSEIKNVVAVKEASGNISDFNKSISATNEITFYSGNDDLTVSMMAYGAKGIISVISNIIPAVMKSVTSLCLEGKFETAAKLHQRYIKLMNSMFCETNPIPIKSACNLIFGFNKSVRLPLTQITERNEEIIYELLKDYNIINY